MNKTKNVFYKTSAFIKRDFLIQISYRFHFILSWLSIFFFILIFYYISQFVGKSVNPFLAEYGGNYFPFVFIGIAFSGFLATALQSFSRNIRREQMMGTLESMLITPTKASLIIFSISLWNFVFGSLSVFIYILFGICFFGLDFAGANFFGASIILVLTILSFSGIGIISAAFIMVFKQGDPITWLINLLSGFFGGVYFPIAVLPGSLRIVSHFLPITYSLRALRHALLKGYNLKMLLPDVAILLAFCLVLLPLSTLIFQYAVKRAKIGGSLAHY